jgi:hypothetical protein
MLIVFSVCSGIATYQDFPCEPYAYRNFIFQHDMMGKYGVWSRDNLTKDKMELYSVSNYSNRIINLPRKTIFNKTITLELTFGPSFRSYLRIIPKNSNSNTIRPDERMLKYLTEKKTIFELELGNASYPALGYFLMQLDAPTITTPSVKFTAGADRIIEFTRSQDIARSTSFWKDGEYFAPCQSSGNKKGANCTVYVTIAASTAQLISITLR